MICKHKINEWTKATLGVAVLPTLTLSGLYWIVPVPVALVSTLLFPVWVVILIRQFFQAKDIFDEGVLVKRYRQINVLLLLTIVPILALIARCIVADNLAVTQVTVLSVTAVCHFALGYYLLNAQYRLECKYFHFWKRL